MPRMKYWKLLKMSVQGETALTICLATLAGSCLSRIAVLPRANSKMQDRQREAPVQFIDQRAVLDDSDRRKLVKKESMGRMPDAIEV
jgi:hypothetical protein